MALHKVRRNIRLLRNQIFPEGTKRFQAQASEQEVMKATERFMIHFFRARGLLPKDPLASREEIREAAREMDVIKQVLSPEELHYVKTTLSEIENLLGRYQVQSAITKMQEFWKWMLTKAFPPPPYIA